MVSNVSINSKLTAEALIRAQLEAERQSDEAARNEAALRVEAVKLVEELQGLISNRAAQLAAARGQSDPFSEDIAADDICHALTEFLIQGILPRADMIEAPICKGFQVSKRHAANWFNVEFDSSGQPVAVEKDGAK